jgi:hypothetical protein
LGVLDLAAHVCAERHRCERVSRRQMEQGSLNGSSLIYLINLHCWNISLINLIDSLLLCFFAATVARTAQQCSYAGATSVVEPRAVRQGVLVLAWSRGPHRILHSLQLPLLLLPQSPQS